MTCTESNSLIIETVNVSNNNIVNEQGERGVGISSNATMDHSISSNHSYPTSLHNSNSSVDENNVYREQGSHESDGAIVSSRGGDFLSSKSPSDRYRLMNTRSMDDIDSNDNNNDAPYHNLKSPTSSPRFSTSKGSFRRDRFDNDKDSYNDDNDDNNENKSGLSRTASSDNGFGTIRHASSLSSSSSKRVSGRARREWLEDLSTTTGSKVNYSRSNSKYNVQPPSSPSDVEVHDMENVLTKWYGNGSEPKIGNVDLDSSNDNREPLPTNVENHQHWDSPQKNEPITDIKVTEVVDDHLIKPIMDEAEGLALPQKNDASTYCSTDSDEWIRQAATLSTSRTMKQNNDDDNNNRHHPAPEDEIEPSLLSASKLPPSHNNIVAATKTTSIVPPTTFSVSIPKNHHKNLHIDADLTDDPSDCETMMIVEDADGRSTMKNEDVIQTNQANKDPPISTATNAGNQVLSDYAPEGLSQNHSDIPHPPSSYDEEYDDEDDEFRQFQREGHYVKSIVKNVEVHGSPKPSKKKPETKTTPACHVQEGLVKIIKEDVETWASRPPQLDGFKVDVTVESEGMVKSAVEDVEKRVVVPSPDTFEEYLELSGSKRMLLKNKESSKTNLVPPPQQQPVADSISTETPQQQNIHSEPSYSSPPTTKDKEVTVEVGRNLGDSMLLGTIDIDSVPKKHVDYVPVTAANINNELMTPGNTHRRLLKHGESSLSISTPPQPPIALINEDCFSIRSNSALSMVSNLSNPTLMGPTSPRMSIHGLNSNSARGDNTRKRISEVIRRDLWSKEERVVEDAICELAETAAGTSQERNTIARSGGLLAIVRAMEQHDSNAGIQIAGCSALEKLALETENEIAIGEVGGVDAVLAAMMQHVGNSLVQEAAWSALWNLTCGNAIDEMTTDTEGGMHAIVACMKQHSSHPEIQRNACGALTNLCLENPKRLRALAEADGFVAIATALQRHWDNESVKIEASHALISLLEKPSNAKNESNSIQDDDDDEYDAVSYES